MLHTIRGYSTTKLLKLHSLSVRTRGGNDMVRPILSTVAFKGVG
jgi:hypothetical protein